MNSLIKTKIILMVILLSSMCGYAQKNAVFAQKSLKHFENTLMQTNENFYMSNAEVSNGLYREFLNDLQKSGDMEKYAIALYDSTRWYAKWEHNKHTAEVYHWHPAYSNYPEVNISYEGAVLFCEWLTLKYNSLEKRAFKKVVFRLPTETEWKHAAKGGHINSPYPWAAPYITNEKGWPLCNYKYIGDEEIRYDSTSDQYIVVKDAKTRLRYGHEATSFIPVVSFFPNDYGIYNMSGNAAEMTAEKGIARGGSFLSPGYDVRIDSEEKYTEPNFHIGFRFCMEVIN